ncbi:FAD-dependent oxidoreductase [Nocardia sp. CC201C]|uniref:FAD-dependent oxidoreductase n=1 Tax=Nocardia sp. CC201C TaxID=3044575 RepID=UPI0024A8CEE7|nr:FAD-dependent oxidoreductase [Nocardia sp. CC201C]
MTPAWIVIVGSGFAGVECARTLERTLRPGEAGVTLVAPDDAALHLPLLPQVAAGVLTARAVSVSPRRWPARRIRLMAAARNSAPSIVRRTDGDLRTHEFCWDARKLSDHVR